MNTMMAMAHMKHAAGAARYMAESPGGRLQPPQSPSSILPLSVDRAAEWSPATTRTRRRVRTAALLVALGVLVAGSVAGSAIDRLPTAYSALGDAVLGGAAIVLLLVSSRALITGVLPRWAGGLGVALAGTGVVEVLQQLLP